MNDNPAPVGFDVTTGPFLEPGHVQIMLDGLRSQIRAAKHQLYKTPKWRKIRRYNLFEKIDKLEEDYGLIDHVMNDDQGGRP